VHACFCCCLPANVLWNALWSDEVIARGAELSQHFEFNGFGNYVLDRERVISAVHAEIKEQLTIEPGNSPSVYLYGCRGMGKTSLLHVLARDLKSKDWEVYWYASASGIPLEAGEAYLAYAEANRSKRIAVLIDEVKSDPNHCIFIELLKDTPSNILVVGAAVPLYIESLSGLFRHQLGRDDLML
jgi:predicted AAA+ superfamily ATPase